MGIEVPGGGSGGSEIVPDLVMVGERACYPKPSSFVDPFTDGLRDRRWVALADAGTTTEETGGALVIEVSGTPGEGENGGYTTTGGPRPHWDVTDDAVWIEVTEAPTDPEIYVYFEVIPVPAPGSFRWFLGNGDLVWQAFSTESVETTGTLTYSAVTHRWWRLRAAAGSVYFDTSPDGAAWTQRGTAPTPFDCSSVGIQIRAECDQADSAGSFRVAGFNTAP